MKPMRAWAVTTRGELTSVLSLFDERDDALSFQNKPAGQRVVPVKIIELKARKRKEVKPH